jgi:hypothetical protein
VEEGDSVYRGEVEGSELYEVYVELDEGGTIISSDCDCPYDYGPVCKHQAAVLIKLGEHAAGSPRPVSIEQLTSPKKSLKQLLEAESKESLITLLLSLVADSHVAEQRVKLHVSKAGGAAELEECRKLIRSTINVHADHHGFVNWRSVSRAVGGAEMVAEKACEAADDAEWVRAVELNLCVMEEMVDFLQEADDSSGTVGGIIDQVLESIDVITVQSDRISQEDREILFQLLLNEAKQSRYDGWSDWQLALLEAASRLAVTADLRMIWEQYTSMIASEQTGAWGSNYFVERVAGMRYHLIQSYEEDGKARDYLNSHLHFSDFRELAIRDAFQNDRYDEVIRLAEEGEVQDQAKGLPGLVKQWKKHRYEAYCHSGYLQLQRELGIELVLDGEFSYYKSIKETYLPVEWKVVYQDMLQKLEKDKWPKDIYTKILVEEHEYSRLLAYVKKQPSQIEQFYLHLYRHFPMEVKELFHIHIEAQADQASTRKHYENVCRIIVLLQQVGGSEGALQIARMLLAKYPKKPAFRDELMKLNYR